MRKKKWAISDDFGLKRAPSFRNHFRQKTVYPNTSLHRSTRRLFFFRPDFFAYSSARMVFLLAAFPFRSIFVHHILQNTCYAVVVCFRFFCFLLFAFCFLLFAFCFLLFAFCFLLFAFCFLIFAFCFLLFAFCSLLFALCFLLFASCFLLLAFFFSIRLMVWLGLLCQDSYPVR